MSTRCQIGFYEDEQDMLTGFKVLLYRHSDGYPGTINGKKYSHLIDPRTGFPIQHGTVSVSVITQNCTSADSLATGFAVMGLRGIHDFLAQNLSTMRMFILTDEGKGKNVHILR